MKTGMCNVFPRGDLEESAKTLHVKLPTGVYFLRFTDEDTKRFKKFIIIK